MKIASDDLAAQWQQTRIDLAARALGGDVLDCSDDFFAEKDNLLLVEDPISLPEKYTAYGKWMDGWESRRRRDAPGYEGCDWVTVRLASVGEIEALEVDTRHFKGNAPGAVQLDYLLADEDPNEQSNWQPLTDRIDVKADSRNLITLDQSAPQSALQSALQSRTASHIRLRIYPDGGVARLRVYGKIQLDQRYRLPGEPLDLAALMNGGRSVACSDSFFSPMQNLLLPGRGADMHNGWETKRRRQGGNDWMVVKLALPGAIHRVEVDTLHFKGNYPDRCSLEACSFSGDNPENAVDKVQWHTILPEQKLHAHRNHCFLKELKNTEQQYTHVRLNIFPDGGVSRLRVLGFESGLEGSDS